MSSLAKWTSTTWSNFCQSSSTQAVLEADLVGPSDLFYNSLITRGPVKLFALVAIKNNFPCQPPIFCLTLHNNVEYHSGNCDAIRDMERAINISWNQGYASASWLLAVQLRHLCSYLDVYLETGSGSFPQNTVFFRNVSGRNRRRPFTFRKIGAGVFT